MSDPYAGYGTPREPLSNFWKPNTGERIIGKLDKITTGKYGDTAHFPNAIVYRTDDHKPIRTGEVLVGISANLEGRITTEDVGRYFVVTFVKFGEAQGTNNAPRLFDVAVVPRDREASLRAALAQDAKRLADPKSDNLGGDDDDLPF